SERALSRLGKAVTVVIGGVGLVVALLEVRVIFDFVLFAWSGIACAFTPVVLCSLFWRRTSKAGAVAGMIVGFATTVVWVRVFKAGFYDLYEMIPGFFAGLLACVAVSLLTAPTPDTAEELDSVRGSIGPVF
ncbi:MAG: sodium:proline symporter, partial [Gemmatimonadota bacterium]|nr:sodium:proline symporter [Gemmatimonadota bacterium]